MPYDGGKGGAGVAQWIINQLPPHRVYIEAFLGGGTVLRMKRPAATTIGIERDAGPLARLWTGNEIPELTLINGDAITWLEDFEPVGDELIYCDPPYVRSARSNPRDLYAYELTDADHARLLAVLKRLSCSIAISGYWSELYAWALRDWRTSQFWTIKRNGVRVQEWLWMNYAEPVALHDSRYLGATFRERERIKRKVARWTNRLGRMSILERRALLAAMQTVDVGIVETGVHRSCITGPDDASRNLLDELASSDSASALSRPSPASSGDAVSGSADIAENVEPRGHRQKTRSGSRRAENDEAAGSSRRKRRCSPAVIVGNDENAGRLAVSDGAADRTENSERARTGPAAAIV